MRGEGSKSVSVRKIENGYVRCESGSDGKGGWDSRETYHQTNPGIESVPAKPQNAVSESSLRQTISHMKRGR